MKNLSSTLFIAIVLLTSCLSDTTKPVTDFNDYSQYLNGNRKDRIKEIDNEISFWQSRFQSTPDDIVARNKIASLLSKRFTYSGNIQEIHAADSLLQLVNAVNRFHSSATYRSLAANSITQHKFLLAQSYIDSALKLGDDKMLTLLMDFDVSMELGNTIKARQILNSLPDKAAFEFLIREAKYKDHAEGDLDAAIQLMEQAYEKVKSSSNEDIKLWALSNLADMYGHANQFRKSYGLYLEVLARDPEYFHALKGIAWLAFSKDRKSVEAKNILNYLSTQHSVPDYHLLLADIAQYENDSSGKDRHLEGFLNSASSMMYGDMYNKYLFNLQAFEFNNNIKALTIAEAEVRNRPTGEAFSWLAWAYLINGQKKKALETVKYHVENKSFEPDVLYSVGKIYLAANDKNKAKKFLSEAAESAYELGPVAQKEIEALLKQL